MQGYANIEGVGIAQYLNMMLWLQWLLVTALCVFLEIISALHTFLALLPKRDGIHRACSQFLWLSGQNQ